MMSGETMRIGIGPQEFDFQKKCLEYLQRIHQEQERTMQHNAYMMQNICDEMKFLREKVEDLQRELRGMNPSVTDDAGNNTAARQTFLPGRQRKKYRGGTSIRRVEEHRGSDLDSDLDNSTSGLGFTSSSNQSGSGINGPPRTLNTNLLDGTENKHFSKHSQMSELTSPQTGEKPLNRTPDYTNRGPRDAVPSPVQIGFAPPQVNRPIPKTSATPSPSYNEAQRVNKLLQKIKKCQLPGEPVIKRQPEKKDFIKLVQDMEVDMTDEVIAAVSSSSERSNIPTSRAVGLHTVIILDTSASMNGRPFQSLKTFVLDMIDKIDASAADIGLEEHIAIVTCGAQTAILQHFTNDYLQIRNILDEIQCRGKTPLMTALLLSLCYLELQGESIVVSDSHLVPPRIIIVSDFKPTDDRNFTNDDIVSGQVRIQMLTKLFTLSHVFKKRKYSISCVPASGESNPDLYDELIFKTGGQLFKLREAALAGNFYRHQVTLGLVCKMVDQMESRQGQVNVEKIINKVSPLLGLTSDCMIVVKKLYDNSLASANGLDEPEEDLFPSGTNEHASGATSLPLNPKHAGTATVDRKSTTVVRTPTRELDQRPELPEWTVPKGMDQIGFTEIARLPSLGIRVKHKVRQPDDQGENDYGTIVGHMEGKVVVVWDRMNNLETLNYGHKNQEDIQVDNQPRQVPAMHIEIGCWVTRGEDWDRGDEDGGEGTVGVVIRKLTGRYVQVRWPSRVIERYRFGAANKWDLKVVMGQPHAAMPDNSVERHTSEQTHDQTHGSGKPTTEEGLIAIWRWKDNNGYWRLFSEESISKLETASLRNPGGKVMIRHCGANKRVSLDSMKCDTDDGMCDIQRTEVTAEELRNLQAVEQFL